MTTRRNQSAEWREFEKLVARIEADSGPFGMTVKSPDRIRCKVTGRLREVDASIRSRVGTAEVLITIECRRRSKIQDVTWVEQLATKKNAIGAKGKGDATLFSVNLVPRRSPRSVWRVSSRECESIDAPVLGLKGSVPFYPVIF